MKTPSFRTGMFRFSLIFCIAVLWTYLAPIFFFLFLNELAFFKTWMTNFGTNIYDVKDFSYWIVIIPMWFFGFIWVTGVFD